MLKKINKLDGGLNLTQSTTIGDNQFTTAKNVFYNNAKQLQTRRGYRTFGNSLGSSPMTSLFFRQRDDTLDRILVGNAGSSFYKYNETTSNRDSVYANNIEYETLPGLTTRRTRRDYAVYKNKVYMGDGVNPYRSYDGTTHALIGVAGAVTCTFDTATDLVTRAAHGLTDGDEVYFSSSGTMPGGVTSYQVYYVRDAAANTFKISNAKNGTAINITSDGTPVISLFKLTEPRPRFIQYLGDRIYGAGDDANPSSLYYTNAAPADATNLNQNVVVVGGDEAGRINGLNEYAQIVIVFKDGKSYAVNVATPSVEAIDSQTGGYSDRTIFSVGNSLIYLNERGIDSLVKRTGADGAGAIESKPLSDDVRPYVSLIDELQYNANCGWYIKKMNNYYFAFDSNNDNRPDKVLVYSSLVGAWTEYVFPSLYDFGYYINEDGEYQYLFTSASGGQVYEYEYGFEDNGIPIDVEVETKDFDFDEPAQDKEFIRVELVGYRQNNSQDITATIKVDGETVGTGYVTNDNIDPSTSSGSIGVGVLGTDPLGASSSDTEGISLYPFTVRIPFWVRGKTIAVNLSSSGVQRIIEKMRVNVNYESIDVFSYNQII